MLPPTVSVIMITYGHEKYIKEAIEGVLIQECDFEVELIIADDCSPDNTETIVNQLKNKNNNGNRINYTKHNLNKGASSNFTWALQQAKGKYIAVCEGDDYWIDPLKLQKQVDFLENNTDYSMCFHNAKRVNLITDEVIDYIPVVDRDYKIDEVFLKWLVPTASMVFKKVVADDFCIKASNVSLLNGDLILVLICCENGKIKGFSEFMSVYNVHENGVSYSRIKNNKINFYKKYPPYYDFIKKTFLRYQGKL